VRLVLGEEDARSSRELISAGVRRVAEVQERRLPASPPLSIGAIRRRERALRSGLGMPAKSGEFNFTLSTLLKVAAGLGVRPSTLLRRAKL
jgi:hypothetical protein